MADDGSILVTGAVGQLGAVGRTVNMSQVTVSPMSIQNTTPSPQLR